MKERKGKRIRIEDGEDGEYALIVDWSLLYEIKKKYKLEGTQIVIYDHNKIGRDLTTGSEKITTAIYYDRSRSENEIDRFTIFFYKGCLKIRVDAGDDEYRIWKLEEM